jgi:hypothetical protein
MRLQAQRRFLLSGPRSDHGGYRRSNARIRRPGSWIPDDDAGCGKERAPGKPNTPAPTSRCRQKALPPLPVAVQAIGVTTIAMIGSSVSSQLVDLDIADIGGAFSISADSASWIACIEKARDEMGRAYPKLSL